MKKETITTIAKSITSVAAAVGSDILERIEESSDAIESKSRQAQLRNEWFSRFKSIPATYRVTTYRGATKVEFETDSAVLICDREGGEVNVTSPFVDENGNKMFLVRDIYGVDEYAIPREEVILLYKGSVENCWLRWYTSAKNKLG